MDSIDITDSTFALDVPTLVQAPIMDQLPSFEQAPMINEINISGGSDSNDNNMFIFLGALILISIIGMFVFKFYQNKNNKNNIYNNNDNNNQLDCPGGFCPINKRPRVI